MKTFPAKHPKTKTKIPGIMKIGVRRMIAMNLMKIPAVISEIETSSGDMEPSTTEIGA